MIQPTKKVTYIDWVGVYEGAVSEEICDMLLSTFDNYSKSGKTVEGQTGLGVNKANKNSEDLNIAAYSELEEECELIAGAIDACYQEYLQEYPEINMFMASHVMSVLQIQKYPNNNRGGYHTFHCEAGHLKSSDRVMTYAVYLNDIKEGGETEFLSQKFRYKPRKGDVVLFPAYFTHGHRGNVVLSDEDKYILTGWYVFEDSPIFSEEGSN